MTMRPPRWLPRTRVRSMPSSRAILRIVGEAGGGAPLLEAWTCASGAVATGASASATGAGAGASVGAGTSAAGGATRGARAVAAGPSSMVTST